MYRLLLVFTFAITLLGTGCNDPITIVETPDAEIDVIYTEAYEVETKTILGEVSSTYNLGVNFSTYLLGALDDPIFGKSTSNINIELDYLIGIPDFDGAILDSAVLMMGYDSLGFYGDTTAAFTIEVRQLLEQMVGDTLLADTVWNVDPTVIGSRTIIPSIYDSITINSHISGGEPVVIGPQLRIPMENDFIQTLIDADPENYLSSESLLEFINGLQISATTDKSAMMGLALDDLNNFSGTNKLRIYYTTDTTEVYDFSFTSRTASTFVHDFSGSMMEGYLADEDHNGDDFAFFQGMSGVEVELSFLNIEELKENIINKAELIYYSIADPNEVNFINKPIDLATLTYQNIENTRTLTTDASLGLNPGPYTSILGGSPVLVDEANGIYRTSVNLTNHLNTVFNTDVPTTNVILTPLQRSERSSRSIIFGSGNPQYKPVLKITYTNI